MLKFSTHITEDILTNEVLGLAHYLPPETFLKPLLLHIGQRNDLGDNLAADAETTAIRFWPGFQVPDEWKKAFLPSGRSDKGGVVPDAVLEAPGWIMFVESELSHAVEAEQLFQQYAIGRREAQRQGKDFYLLLLNSSLSRPIQADANSINRRRKRQPIPRKATVEDYVSRCLRIIGQDEPPSAIRRRLLWTNWRSAAELAGDRLRETEDRRDQASTMASRLLRDSLDLLSANGHAPISFVSFDALSALIKSLPREAPFMTKSEIKDPAAKVFDAAIQLLGQAQTIVSDLSASVCDQLGLVQKRGGRGVDQNYLRRMRPEAREGEYRLKSYVFSILTPRHDGNRAGFVLASMFNSQGDAPALVYGLIDGLSLDKKDQTRLWWWEPFVRHVSEERDRTRGTVKLRSHRADNIEIKAKMEFEIIDFFSLDRENLAQHAGKAVEWFRKSGVAEK